MIDESQVSDKAIRLWIQGGAAGRHEPIHGFGILDVGDVGGPFQIGCFKPGTRLAGNPGWGPGSLGRFWRRRLAPKP